MITEVDIVQVVKENVLALSTPCAWAHGTKALQNVFADEEKFPLCYLEEPIESNDTITQGGLIQPVYPLVFCFAKKIELDATTDEQRAVIVPMRVLAKELLLRFQADKRIIFVQNSRRLDVMNIFDVNCSGCFLFVTLTPRDASSICLP